MNRIDLAPGAVVLQGFAVPYENKLQQELQTLIEISPFRQMQTSGGYTMSVAMSNCGALGWITDGRGYRYAAADPLTGSPWPEMPNAFQEMAEFAAKTAGYEAFNPNGCLINRYETGAKMSLHQDKDECGFEAPIVSVSLGVPAIFLFGGKKRSDKTSRTLLTHGDVVVWGGESRLNFHGILPVKASYHPFAGSDRINLTFRQVFSDSSFTT